VVHLFRYVSKRVNFSYENFFDFMWNFLKTFFMKPNGFSWNLEFFIWNQFLWKGLFYFIWIRQLVFALFSWEFSTKRYKQHGDGVSISYFFFVMYLCQVLIWNIFTNVLLFSICLFIWNVLLWLFRKKENILFYMWIHVYSKSETWCECMGGF